MDTTTIAGASVAVLVTALVQLIKTAFPALPTRFIPLLTALATFALVVLASYVGKDAPPLSLPVLVGALVAALAPAGLYAAGKALIANPPDAPAVTVTSANTTSNGPPLP